MNILFVCRFLPHPWVRDSGGQDVYHYIAALSERHSISLISFVTPGQEEAVDSMRRLCEKVVAVPYRPDALFARLWRAGWRLLLPRVYGRVFSLCYRKSLRDLLNHISFDVVIVDGMMAQYGNLIHKTKKILDEIDVYSVVAYHIYSNEKRCLSRMWAMLDWLKQQVFELQYASSYDGVLVRSKEDQEFLKRFIPSQNITVLLPWFEGLDTLLEITSHRPKGNRLLFLGAMNLPANVEAVHYFVQSVFPMIRQRVPDAEFYIVGGSPVPSVWRLTAVRGVVVTGEVEDLKPYYEHCAVNVVPLLRGGGIIVKTLNGMAAGRPTIATSWGNAGTGAQPGRDLIVVDEPELFADTVIDLLTSRQLWREIATNGRRYVIDNFDWLNNVKSLEKTLQQ
jgi:polysaccharide biosynthesis protein PslH